MSNHQPKTPADIAISNVFVNPEAIAPLALKYPAGQLMIALPAHSTFVQQAAKEAHLSIFIVNNGKRLLVYHTRDGIMSSVPDTDPLAFFEAFQRLQIEAMQFKERTPEL